MHRLLVDFVAEVRPGARDCFSVQTRSGGSAARILPGRCCSALWPRRAQPCATALTHLLGSQALAGRCQCGVRCASGQNQHQPPPGCHSSFLRLYLVVVGGRGAAGSWDVMAEGTPESAKPDVATGLGSRAPGEEEAALELESGSSEPRSCGVFVRGIRPSWVPLPLALVTLTVTSACCSVSRVEEVTDDGQTEAEEFQLKVGDIPSGCLAARGSSPSVPCSVETRATDTATSHHRNQGGDRAGLF